MVETQDQ